MKLRMPILNSDSEALMLSAVVAASPGTQRFSSTKKLAKMPQTKMNRYATPATLAYLFIFHEISRCLSWDVLSGRGLLPCQYLSENLCEGAVAGVSGVLR